MERIRQLRKERGLSQARLAVMADMDPATLNRLERGTGNPNLKTLERVAEALGVEVADFFPKGTRRSSRQASLLNGLEDERRAYQAVSEALMTTVDQLANTEPPRSLDDVVKRFGIVEVLYGVFEALDERGRSARPVLFRVAAQLLEQSNEYLKHRREDSEASREAEAARELMREWNQRLSA